MPEKKIMHPAELAKASHMKPGDPRVTLLAEVSGLRKLERFYNEIEIKPGQDFITALFDHLELEIQVDDADLAQIPATGGIAFVANHPYGAIDGLAMLNVLERARPDIKVMANFMLQQLEPLADRFIGVNPFEQLSTRSSFQGMRQAMEHLAQGRALGVFPAGEVSSYRKELDVVADPRWKNPVIKLILNAQVPVVPMWFDGANSLVFQMLGMIHPQLRTLRLPNEMLRMRGRTVRMRIGKPILPKDLATLGPVEQVAKYLRAKTYALGSGAPVLREQFKPLRILRRPKDLVPPIAPDVLESEIATIADRKVSVQAEFDLYIAQSGRIPNVLREIGRLREETFRAVGEGTNKAIDLDEFDHYYDHLFLWDRVKRKIAGAYRIGDARMIMDRYGRRGLYTSTLFRMDKAIHPVLAQSFELGRSFVTIEYQKHRLPLFLLWRGLLVHITGNPEHRYLIGPVSISSAYSRLSRSLIMDFVQQHHYDHELARYVQPRNRFEIHKERADGEALLQASGEDLKKLDKLIADIETSGSTVPVLLKKYLLLNAKIIGFNSDPRFNDALDGLMILDLTKLPERVVEDLKRGMNG